MQWFQCDCDLDLGPLISAVKSLSLLLSIYSVEEVMEIRHTVTGTDRPWVVCPANDVQFSPLPLPHLSFPLPPSPLHPPFSSLPLLLPSPLLPSLPPSLPPFLLPSPIPSDESQVLDSLPKKMKSDLAIHVHLDTLCKISLFQV